MYMIIELHVIKNGSNTGHQKDIMFKKESGLRAENMLRASSMQRKKRRKAVASPAGSFPTALNGLQCIHGTA